MALISLTQGLVWRKSGLTDGFAAPIPSNYGTDGSLAKYRFQRYTLGWTRLTRSNGPGEPIYPQYNRAAATAWHRVANAPGPVRSLPTPAPSAPVDYTAPGSAALIGAGPIAGTVANNTSQNSMLK